MSGDINMGRCYMCLETSVPISRQYYYYDIKCDCHSPKHFEFVEHCSKCTPQPPRFTIVYIDPISPDDDERPWWNMWMSMNPNDHSM